jgi:hypothetical protein
MDGFFSDHFMLWKVFLSLTLLSEATGVFVLVLGVLFEIPELPWKYTVLTLLAAPIVLFPYLSVWVIWAQ